MVSISLEGHLGPVDAIALRDRLDPILSGPRPVVHLDLGNVSTMHTSLVVVVLSANRRAVRNKGEVRVTPPSQSTAGRALTLTNVLELLS